MLPPPGPTGVLGDRTVWVRRMFLLALAPTIGALLLVAGCSGGSGGSSGATSSGAKPTIVVTYSVLGSVVRDLVGDRANVSVPMPNGQDPHEWEPSAKDIAAFNKANLIVRNGLALEGGLEKTLDSARDSGVTTFIASDYIQVRHVGQGEGIPTSDPDQQTGAEDPHLWMDPLTVKQVVPALADQLKVDLGLDVSDRAADLENRLDALNARVEETLSPIPADRRSLVTGHESLGYFAQRYRFKLVGAIVPSITSQAESSAGKLATLKQAIIDSHVPTVFTEVGTSRAVADAIGRETGARVVELTTHALPPDGSYFTFMENIASVIAQGLK